MVSNNTEQNNATTGQSAPAPQPRPATTPKNKSKRKQLTDYKVQLLSKLKVLMARERFEEAEALLLEALGEGSPVPGKAVMFRILLNMKLCETACMLKKADVAQERGRKLLDMAAAEGTMKKNLIMVDALMQNSDAQLSSDCPSQANLAEAKANLTRALELVEDGWEDLKNTPRHGKVLSKMGNVLLLEAKFDEGLTMQLRALKLVEGTPLSAEVTLSLANALHTRAVEAEAHRDTEVAQTYWDRAGFYYHKVLSMLPGKSVQRGMVLRSFAEAMLHQNLVEEAGPVLQAASRIFLEHDHPIELVQTWLMLIKNAIVMKNYNLAFMTHNQVVRQLEKVAKEGRLKVDTMVLVEVTAVTKVLEGVRAKLAEAGKEQKSGEEPSASATSAGKKDSTKEPTPPALEQDESQEYQQEEGKGAKGAAQDSEKEAQTSEKEAQETAKRCSDNAQPAEEEEKSRHAEDNVRDDCK